MTLSPTVQHADWQVREAGHHGKGSVGAGLSSPAVPESTNHLCSFSFDHRGH